MNIMDILGGLMQAKTAPSASRRMKNVFGADESSKHAQSPARLLRCGF